ncbi:MAG: glycoside hydrolase family 2 protein [Ruminococcaceae bacterium]|nr:glycoside hydrolase family 2 protein [Oscillospiraceae bacterium]
MRTLFNADKNWKFKAVDDTNIENGANSHAEIYSSVKTGAAHGEAGFKYNDDDWRIVDLPHDRRVEVGFDDSTPPSHGSKIRENVWYRKSFEMPTEYINKHFTLVFEGISVFSNIYFNGSLAGRSTSAYSETVLDITPRVKFGKSANLISVEVDGKSCEGWWYEGTGIYRHVKLYAKELLHIAHNGLWINPVKGDGNKWSVFAEIEVENSAYTPSGEFTVEVELFDRYGESVAVAKKNNSMDFDETKTVKLEMTVEDPDIWDINEPNLYKAFARIYRENELLDEDSTNFGFRTFYFDNEKGFFLNGRHILLKGVCCHQDHAGVGVAVPDSIQDMRIQILKEWGVNAYRCAHNIPAREILDACDKYGILVMDENRRFEANDDTLLNIRTMVKRDRNHPSVIMWSIFNEEAIQGSEESSTLYARLKSAIKKLDPTRPTTAAQNTNFYTGTGAIYEMDVFGVNYNHASVDKIRAEYPNIPTTGSENLSALAIRGQQTRDLDNNLIEDFDSYTVPWGCTMQDAWKVLSEREWIAGLFIWTGFDYRGEPTPFKYPTVVSLFGVFDLCGYPKASAHVMRACFTDEPMMKILHHWNHKEGEKVKIMTVTNADEVELYLNGESLGRRESKLSSQCYWEIEFVPGVLNAIGYKDGEIVCEDTLRTPSAPSRIIATAHKAVLDNSGKDASAIDVYLTDASGSVVHNADNLIKFKAIGDCEIIGVGNGNPNSHEAEKASERYLFAGRCQAIMQVKDRAEKASVVISCEGCADETITFDIVNAKQDIYLPESYGRKIDEITVSNVTFPEKPDPNMVLSDTDMNNFVSWKMEVRSFQDFDKGWKFYRHTVKIPTIRGENKKALLSIGHIVYLEYEVWINGRLVDSDLSDYTGSQNPWPTRRKIYFDTCGDDSFEITIIIRANAGKAGIYGGEKEFSFSIL